MLYRALPVSRSQSHPSLTVLEFPTPLSRGYEFCEWGVLEYSGRSCRTGGNGHTLGPVGVANPQVGFGRCSRNTLRSNSPILRMSTRAKHLHGERPEYLSACKRLTSFR